MRGGLPPHEKSTPRSNDLHTGEVVHHVVMIYIQERWWSIAHMRGGLPPQRGGGHHHIQER
jgi:hypothetical protein